MGENVLREARFVAGGHVTETPVTWTYTFGVSRDLVLIDFTIASLNALLFLSCDIHNAYLTADFR